MKLYCFLLSFTLVNMSSFSTKMDYMKDVAITNAHIELAYNMNNIAIKDKVVLNGLEHVIKQFIENNQIILEDMNNMFAVPEYQCHDWDVLREIQQPLGAKIQLELNIPVPAVPDENFIRLDLDELGVKRREFTRTALKNILNRTINYKEPENVTHLINERRNLGTDTFENRISRALAGPEKEISMHWMCRLIALFMSTKYPGSHIKNIQINSDGTCILKDDYWYSSSTHKKYKKIEGQWYQIIGDVVGQPLKELL